jgi:hypothetical protein
MARHAAFNALPKFLSARKQMASQALERTRIAKGNGAPLPEAGAGASPARLNRAEQADQRSRRVCADRRECRTASPCMLARSGASPQQARGRLFETPASSARRDEVVVPSLLTSGVATSHEIHRKALKSLDLDSDVGALVLVDLVRSRALRRHVNSDATP